MNHASFLKTFLNDKNVAAFTPTSTQTIKKVCSFINFGKDLTIVEYGPGSGVCTKELLKNLSPNSKLLTIETNKDFVNYLDNINDQRLINISGSAHDIFQLLEAKGIRQVDYVISSIPFTFFSHKTRHELVQSTHKCISPGGTFIVYQYSPLMKKYLEKLFDKVSMKYSPLNIPGIFIMVASKNSIEV